MKIVLRIFAGALVLIPLQSLIICSCQSSNIEVIEQWGIFELVMDGPSAGNPYLENSIEATFTNASNTFTVPGFYDGSGTYKVRFSPDQTGDWAYVTQSNVVDLNNIQGSFRCVDPTGNNHGPLRVVRTHYLEYADRSPFYSVGTTAYQWTSVKQSIQEQTVNSLAESPFNKIRMCVFPKNYRYGNDTDPWMFPFKKIDGKNDPSQPNYAFFQNFDQRVEQLLEMGIQADVILFHPYDIWGYYQMGKKMNEKYVRYMIARLSAYRNVWWSLANEWDVPRIREEIDWEGIGTLLQNEDPHQRLRGIHNWYYDESHFYDHTRPWVTHVSAQTCFFFNAIKWRNKFQKPILFDEMRYEGDVSSNWGNMNGKEMTSYFWRAGLSGVYGTHGDTYRNDADQETEVRWWAKGGKLVGESPARIAFFKKIMEEAPVSEMTPKLVSLSGLPIPDTIPDRNSSTLIEQLNHNIYILSKEDEYYLAYTADTAQTIELNLGGSKEFTLEVIDTWNMSVVAEKAVGNGKFHYETEMPFTALRITAR